MRHAAAQPAPPDLRQVERGEQALEEMRVAEPGGERPSDRDRRLHREREDFRIRRFRVLAAEAFEPRLGALAAALGLRPENRAEIGIFDHPSGLAGRQIVAADRNRIFGPQAKLLPRRVGGQEQPAPDLLAGHVEEDRRGLENCRFDPGKSGGQKMIERALPRGAGRVGRNLDVARLQSLDPGISRPL